MRRFLLAAATALALAAPGFAQDPGYTRTDDVIYGRKFGLAMTLDVFTPKGKPNGKGIIFCMSGGWVSNKPGPNPPFGRELTDRGYTVFAVMHGAQPKFTIPEVLEDMHRAVRFVRANAKKYNVDPDRLGISGGSAGGHLSLMQGNAPKAGNPKAADPVERESSRVACVACLFPPTDFLNWGKEGRVWLGEGQELKSLRPPFDFWERDGETNKLVVIEDPERRKAIGKQVSPAYHVSKESVPTLVVHGDADTLVPIQQAELIGAKYKEFGVPFELVVKKGAGHGGPAFADSAKLFADWFDKNLK